MIEVGNDGKGGELGGNADGASGEFGIGDGSGGG